MKDEYLTELVTEIEGLLKQVKGEPGAPSVIEDGPTQAINTISSHEDVVECLKILKEDTWSAYSASDNNAARAWSLEVRISIDEFLADTNPIQFLECKLDTIGGQVRKAALMDPIFNECVDTFDMLREVYYLATGRGLPIAFGKGASA